MNEESLSRGENAGIDGVQYEFIDDRVGSGFMRCIREMIVFQL